MNKKREKVILEINKTKEKIAELHEKLRELEQQKISMKNPRGILEEIDDIISRIAKEELARQTTNSE